MTAMEYSEARATHSSWAFFRNWVLAGTIGWGVSYFALWVVIMIAATFVRGLGEGFLFLASLPAIAAVVGALQWLVMRRQVWGGGRWALAAVVGSVCWAVAFQYSRGAVSHPANQAYAVRLGMILLYVAGAGAVIGTLQWLFVLRRQVRHAYWWIPASSLGWAVAPLEWIWDLNFGPSLATVVVRRALLGAAFGAVTGVCLIHLLKHTGRGMPGSKKTAA